MNEFKTTLKYLSQALAFLDNKMDDFYLVGGTALALHYQHRESYDLDFFTKNFQLELIKKVIKNIECEVGKRFEILGQSTGQEVVKQIRYQMSLGKKEFLKIDFVEDLTGLMNPLDKKNGIYLASIDDIYLRKIYAVSGIPVGFNDLGRIQSKGGRQTARDLFDLYHLSRVRKSLSRFVIEHAERINIEGLVTWFYGLDKPSIKMGLSEIVTNNPVEYYLIERCLFPEMEKILEEISGYE